MIPRILGLTFRSPTAHYRQLLGDYIMRKFLIVLALTGSSLALGATTATAAPSDQPAQAQSSAVQEKRDNCKKYETKQSRVKICKVDGELLYHGSSAVGKITLPAHRVSSGTYETEENNGHVYTINSSELVITRDGEVISEQPVTKTSKSPKSTNKKNKQPAKQEPNSKTPRDEGSFRYQAPDTNCVQKGTTINCTTPYGSYRYSYQP